MTKEEQEADRIYNSIYIEIFEYGEEMSEEIVISILTKKCALLHVNGLIEILDDMYNGYYTMPSEVSDKVDSLEKVKEIIESK